MNLLPIPLTDFLLYYQKSIFWETVLWKDRGVDWSFRVRHVFSQEPRRTITTFQQPQPLKVRVLLPLKRSTMAFLLTENYSLDQYPQCADTHGWKPQVACGKEHRFPRCTKIWAPILVHQLPDNMILPLSQALANLSSVKCHISSRIAVYIMQLMHVKSNSPHLNLGQSFGIHSTPKFLICLINTHAHIWMLPQNQMFWCWGHSSEQLFISSGCFNLRTSMCRCFVTPIFVEEQKRLRKYYFKASLTDASAQANTCWPATVSSRAEIFTHLLSTQQHTLPAVLCFHTYGLNASAPTAALYIWIKWDDLKKKRKEHVTLRGMDQCVGSCWKWGTWSQNRWGNKTALCSGAFWFMRQFTTCEQCWCRWSNGGGGGRQGHTGQTLLPGRPCCPCRVHAYMQPPALRVCHQCWRVASAEVRSA